MTIHLSGPSISTINRSSLAYQSLHKALLPLSQKDPTLWGDAPTAEAIIRLNWIDLPRTSRALLPELDALYAWSRSKNISRIILCGMGGSSLAPEVIAKVYKKELIVLDSTDPDQIAESIPADYSQTVVVVGSKSGSTIETASQRAFFAQQIVGAGLSLSEHMIVVTDPGSPLDQDARTQGFRVIHADPHVGGRFSALSAFGLVPAALMGVDVSELLDDALAASESFLQDPSVAVDAATLLYELTEQAIAFYDEGSALPGISDWIEQLIAESTGKDEKGRLPIVIENAHASVGGRFFTVAFAGGSADLVVEGALGAQFIFWEWVTALLSKAIGIDPFNQPNVTEAKKRTSALLQSWSADTTKNAVPLWESENIQIFGAVAGDNLQEIMHNFLQRDNYYFAVMAYLNRESDGAISQLRESIAQQTQKPTTFVGAHASFIPRGNFTKVDNKMELSFKFLVRVKTT